MKNLKLTQLDTNQITQRKFDEENDAERVVVVGQNLSVDSDKIARAIKESLKEIKITTPDWPINNSFMPIEIEKHTFIPKIETIEVPIILKEIEYREIEKPIYIEKIVTVEKPIIIKEIEFREIVRERHYPLVLKIAAVAQVFLMLGILLINLFKR